MTVVISGSTESCLAVIPARSGSKRIPNKSIKHFCGKPILEYAIHSAINSGVLVWANILMIKQKM